MRLQTNVEKARGDILEAIKNAYNIVVTQSAAGDLQSFKVIPGDEPLFVIIKGDTRSRIEDNPVSADALLPGGPYDLWRPGETARRIRIWWEPSRKCQSCQRCCGAQGFSKPSWRERVGILRATPDAA